MLDLITKKKWALDVYQNNFVGMPISRFWDSLLAYLHIQYTHDPAVIPTTGKCLVLCNHPSGMVDGVLVGSLVEQIRKDYMFIANKELLFIDQLKDKIFPIQFSQRFIDQKKNYQSLDHAIRYLNQGHVLILFPSGEVATSKFIFDQQIEGQWKMVDQIIKKSPDTTVILLNIQTQSSLLFQAISKIHKKLRMVLMIRELLHQQNRHIQITLKKIEQPIPVSHQLRELCIAMRQTMSSKIK
tara:strand:+ start:1192 stop:1914 length:723 start_codon:yes stop_codon:yes gene_type:complete